MNPDNDEYDYHVKRMLLICNQNLFNNAINLEIFKFIRSRSFSRYADYGILPVDFDIPLTYTLDEHGIPRV